MTSTAMQRRIVYVQYTNPAGYPPLEHSSRLLAANGWQVLFLGTAAVGNATLEFEPHPNITVRSLDFRAAGIVQKLHYLRFLLWCAWHTARFRPAWIYASDMFSTPAALLLSALPGVRVVYHEHDAPGQEPHSWLVRQLLHCRRVVARNAHAVVIPSIERARCFVQECAMELSRVLCVWNCPSRSEAIPERPVTADSTDFWLLYHGSIVPDRLPLTILEAMATLPSCMKLRIIGYETAGSKGYMAMFLQHAASLGLTSRVQYLGVVVERSRMLDYGRRSHIGLALMPMHSTDINMKYMAGASNKPFEYLACGCALLTSDLPEWNAIFVASGLARACDPADPHSIATALRLYLDNPAALAAASARGREKVLAEWSYEQQFMKVYRVLEAAPAERKRGYGNDRA